MTLNVLYTAKIYALLVLEDHFLIKAAFQVRIDGEQHVQKCFSYVQRLLGEELYA